MTTPEITPSQKSSENIDKQEDVVDIYSEIKKNIPTTSTNPLKLINAGGLLQSAKSDEEKTMSFFDAMKLPVNKNAKNVLVRTTVAMVTLPILAFFLSYFFLFTPAEWGGDLYFQDSLTYSGVVAVITVNLVMAFFVFYSMVLDPDRDEGYDVEDKPTTKASKKETKKKAKSAEPIESSDNALADEIEQDGLRSRGNKTTKTNKTETKKKSTKKSAKVE